MENYTKDQLVKAMTKYVENYFNNENAFDQLDKTEDPVKVAERQVEYLLSLVE